MERAAEQTEVVLMTNEQSTRLEIMARLNEVQNALDQITDPASRTILEDRKKELTERLEPK